uniref:VWFA domain-containing protein n=1 Tax=Rhabditophanes sp. KR3021 TaxID=114890 RepID=A0AC35TQA9_9BILA
MDVSVQYSGMLLNDVSHGHGNYPQPPFFQPCQFPTQLTDPENFKSHCLIDPQVPYICDLHGQIFHSQVSELSKAYTKHEKAFQIYNPVNNTIAPAIGIVVVKQLAAPSTIKEVYSDQEGYGCMFDDECGPRMDKIKLERFVNSYKTYARTYAHIIHNRWFSRAMIRDNQQRCPDHSKDRFNNIFVLVVVDGLANDNRKIPSVIIHTENEELRGYLSNIQLETATAINQNMHIALVIVDLIDQLGKALRVWQATNGNPPQHFIPTWAKIVFAVCILTSLLLVFVEHYIVRRKLIGKRASPGVKMESGKSKTHIMFGG